MSPRGVPLLQHPVSEPSAFTAESLIAAVRNQRNLASQTIPSVCLLEFDGDLTDWIVATGRARVHLQWACFHTVMHTIEVDGNDCGIIPRTIGGPYAVLIAEQLRASGAKIILGLTSAGRVASSLPIPSLVVVREAIRDEGTSYHYLPPSQRVHSDDGLASRLSGELKALGVPLHSGCVWTTDAPYRETQQELDQHAADGVLAVEMQAASLLAFSKATGVPVGVVALVSNAVDHSEDPFDKGSQDFGEMLLRTMCRSALCYQDER
jgi:uridine phosphorylase